jgi:hypothetical protein
MSVTACVGGPNFYPDTSTLLLDRVSQKPRIPWDMPGYIILEAQFYTFLTSFRSTNNGLDQN